MLQEDGRALRGAEEEDGVDVREVHALVVEVGGEDDVDLAPGELPQGLPPYVRRGCSTERQGGNACLSERSCHVLGVPHAYAEAQRTHLADVGHFVVEFPQHDPSARVIACE